jgi:CheY-like chemotaxis protein
MATTVSTDPESFRLAGKRALIVDDDDDARYLLRALLESCQMTVCDSDNVDGALEELRKAPYDLIVSDIGMPDRDGYSFIHAVRNRAEGRSIPAVALTSFARPEDRARALAAGFDRHCGKPCESSKLIPCVASLLKA